MKPLSQKTGLIQRFLSDFRPDDVIESLARIQKGEHSIKDVHLLDKFWRLKQEVYSVLINSTIGTYSDYICHDYLFRNKNKVNAQSFFASESEFKKQNSALFTTLKHLRHSLDNPTKLPQIPSKRERRYFINDVEIATPENVFERYVSSKTTIEKEKDHGQQHTLEVSSYKLSQKLF